MGINSIAPGSASPTAALFYDTGTRGATGALTKVAGVPVAAAVEIQSTLGGLLLPRMTTAQRVALTPLVDGMQVYDSTLGDIVTRKGGAWVQQAPVTGVQYAAGTLTAANINAMYGAGQPILPVPGAGFMYVIHGCQLGMLWVQDFAQTAAGPAYLQYGAAGHAGKQATGDIAGVFFTASGASANYYVTGALTDGPTLQTNNIGIYITNGGSALTAGVGTTVTWRVWYSVVPIAA